MSNTLFYYSRTFNFGTLYEFETLLLIVGYPCLEQHRVGAELRRQERRVSHNLYNKKPIIHIKEYTCQT